MITFPMKSKRLKAEIRMTGIQLPRRQLCTSDSIPGKSDRVTKYARPIDSMYGQTYLATSKRARKPSVTHQWTHFVSVTLQLTEPRPPLCTTPISCLAVCIPLSFCVCVPLSPTLLVYIRLSVCLPRPTKIILSRGIIFLHYLSE